MEQEQIKKMHDAAQDEAFQAFLRDEGWKYETEEDIRSAYARKTKSNQGIALTENEFLAELRVEDGTREMGRQLYAKVRPLVETGALRAVDLYQYAYHRWCFRHPEAVIACEIWPKRWAVNSCGEEISVDRAKLIVNREWGFEASRIEIFGTPYYDATDWNFIRFRCCGMVWVMHDDSLSQVYQ